MTTTSSPRRRRARCTWAIEAAAIGALSNSAKISSSGRPRSASTIAAHVGERLRRDPVAQQLELADELGREDPLARGEDLAELDVGRPEASRRRSGAAATARRCDATLARAGGRRGTRAPTRRAERARARVDDAARRRQSRRRRVSVGTSARVRVPDEVEPDRATGGRVGIDEPRGVVAEGADGEVGRALGVMLSACDGAEHEAAVVAAEAEAVRQHGPGLKGAGAPVTMSRWISGSSSSRPTVGGMRPRSMRERRPRPPRSRRPRRASGRSRL